MAAWNDTVRLILVLCRIKIWDSKRDTLTHAMASLEANDTLFGVAYPKQLHLRLIAGMHQPVISRFAVEICTQEVALPRHVGHFAIPARETKPFDVDSTAIHNCVLSAGLTLATVNRSLGANGSQKLGGPNSCRRNGIVLESRVFFSLGRTA